MTQTHRDPGAATPVVLLHPSASFRRGLADPLQNQSLLLIETPTNLPGWLAGDSRRVLVIGDGDADTLIPACGDNTAVLVLISELNVGAYRRALAAGAHGVAHIDADPDTIAVVARAAITGEVVMPVEIARGLAGWAQPTDLRLTAEELGLLQRLSDGATVIELAAEFYLAERSVRRRLQNVYIRLGVSGRAAALKRASQLGLVE